jgi:hypothetical protein
MKSAPFSATKSILSNWRGGSDKVCDFIFRGGSAGCGEKRVAGGLTGFGELTQIVGGQGLAWASASAIASNC